MKKALKRILLVVIILLIIVGGYLILDSTTTQAYTPGVYNGSIFSSAADTNYSDHLESNVKRPDASYVIDATKNYTFVDEEYKEQVEEVTYDGLYGLQIPETGKITYEVDILEEGYYNIKVKYYTIPGRNSSICKGLQINDEYQFKEAEAIDLYRVWMDEFDVATKRKDGAHDLKPRQIEKNKWNEETLRDTEGYYGTSYLFKLKKGINKLTFVAVQEPVVFNSITIFQEDEIKTYEQTKEIYKNEKLKIFNGKEIITKVQGESSYEKSSPSLAPVASYASFKTEPYAKFLTRYNTIGGSDWNITGDWISWELDVKEEGLYYITLKVLQNYNHGQKSSRVLYLNDKIPFEECKELSFNYSSDWQNVTLGNDKEAYLFHLKKGKNVLRLENTIGEYGRTVRDINQVIASLNWLYRKVIMRTGVSPSKYHDFNLKENIPGLYETIDDCIDKLIKAIDTVVSISGERSNLISSLERTKYQLETFYESEKKIQTGLNELETNITSLGTWIQTVTSQPLSIDYILVHEENASLPKAKTNFFQKIGHEFVMLVGSYKSDTSLKSSVHVDGGPTIQVWIMTGRDQSNLLRQLIDESFTMQHGINVELKLVTSSVLLPATLSGNGPDVAIGVGQNIPVNWGIRNSVVDMSKFDDFSTFAENFYDSAITPFRFNGATYALPDTQDFLIQFVRTDIFKELNIVNSDGSVSTPRNWDEVIDLLPVLQRQYLDYYLPNVTGALSPLMYAMIEQYGGKLYLDNGASSGMMLKESANAFYDFVDFYANYGFAVDASFVNRFRTGEMPIGVTNFTLYNTLAVSAPEIRGSWDFAYLPGHVNEDNTTSYASTSTSTGTIILSSSKDVNASWEFVKWWLGEEAQEGYARGLEAILGAAARYATANKEAFKSLPWSAKDYRMLESQRAVSKGIPIVPGDYIVGRYIDNAFRKVINDGINPSDSLFNYYQKINAELKRKRKEFDLD